MLQLAIPVFVLMTGAALLGFLVAWTWRKLIIQSLESELIQVKNVNHQIESERQNLVQHTTLLQSEKESLLLYQTELDEEKKILTEHLESLTNEKISLKNQLDRNLIDGTESFNQNKLVQLEKKLAIQLAEIQEKEKEIRDYRLRIAGQLPPSDIDKLKDQFKSKYSEKKKKWEEKYQDLHFKLLKVARERDELKNGLRANNLSSGILRKKKSKEKSLDKIKRKFNEWQDRSEVKKGSKKNNLLTYKFGDIEKDLKNYNEELVDNLQIITGISYTIEEKLNALGVYRFEQISRLEAKDILLISKILDLDPNYILKNKWVSEAKKLKKK
jgi:Uncharacterized conserved protein